MAYATNASGKRPSESSAADPNAPIAIRSRSTRDQRPLHARLGPMEKIYLFWLVGASCDGCTIAVSGATNPKRSEEHTSELQSHHDLVCRLLLDKKKKHY